MKKIELFYDIVSPYSRLALVVLERYCPARWPLELVLRPAFLGGVMKEVGNVPPASLPQRAPYLLRDVGRLSAYVGVPMMLPDPFPGTTLTCMRFITAVNQQKPALLPALTRAFFDRHWGDGKEVDSEAAIFECARTVGLADPEIAAFFAQTKNPAIKDLLKKAGEEVVSRGAFGFPAIFVDKDGSDEMFFGHDRLPVLASELGLPWDGPHPSSS